MSSTIFLLALPVAVVSAIRGIWSPCGLSMLSSLTPMTEAGRGNRFGVTAAWFATGGVAGGLSLGALAAAGAAGIDAVGLAPSTRLALGAVVALATAAVDLGLLGVELPIFKRQVDDAWLRRYRSWVYGAGFGWQIGFGVATYIMTAGVLLTIALALLTASPALALAVGGVFGLVRGSAVLIGRSATTPAALGAVHQRLEALAPASRAAAAWVQVLAAASLAALAWHPAAGVAVVGLALLATVRPTARLALRP
ncbi:MAG: hypothetical protein KF703_12690 [Actinobacteria bacterium]|nr:hypothetical protein [Actinomycetota bacterium]